MTEERIGPNWKPLFVVARIAALLSVAVILISVALYFVWPYSPGRKTTVEIFQMLQANPFGGLVSLDLFLLVGVLLTLPLYLGLYAALRKGNEGLAILALALGMIAVFAIIPDRPLLEMLSLSGDYTAASSEVARQQLLAAGTAQLALFDGIGWFLSNLLGGVSLLISSFLMLRSHSFSRATAYVGIATNAAVCAFFVPLIGVALLFLSLLGYVLWDLQLARAFARLGRTS